MNDFLKELFEAYYKEQRRQDKINLLKNEINFFKDILEYGFSIDLGKVETRLREKEDELKRLMEE